MRKKQFDQARHYCLTSEVIPDCGRFVQNCMRQLRSHMESTSDLDQARSMALLLTRRRDVTTEDYFALGRIEVQREKWDEALAAFERVEADAQLGADARYNRLLILDGLGRRSDAEREILWQELVGQHPRVAAYALGYTLHLARRREWTRAGQMIKPLSPDPRKVTEGDRRLLDQLFYELFERSQPSSRHGLIYRWEQWVQRSDLRSLRLSEAMIEKRDWKAARAHVRAFLRRLLDESDSLMPWRNRAFLLHGIILSALNQHEEAARVLDACAVLEDRECEGWLARECAYLGRWDLSYLLWKRELARENNTQRTQAQLRRLIKQAEDHDVQGQLAKKWAYPPWMRTRF